MRMPPLFMEPLRVVLHSNQSNNLAIRDSPIYGWLVGNKPKVELFEGDILTFSTSPVLTTLDRYIYISPVEESTSPQNLLSTINSRDIALVFVYDRLEKIFRAYAEPFIGATLFYRFFKGIILVSTSLPDLALTLDDLLLNPVMIAEHFLFTRNLSADMSRTFLSEIFQVPPGHFLCWDGKNLGIHCYWNPTNEQDFEQLQLQDAALRVSEAIDRAIDKHLPQSKVGCLISGGLDSSLIAASVRMRQEIYGGNTLLFTLRNSLDSKEEQQYQSMLAHHLGLPIHILEIPHPRLQIEPLRKMNYGANAPSGGLFTGIYHDAQESMAQFGVTCSFGGEGGDEIFSASSQILADFFTRRQWTSLWEALGFYSSIFFDNDSLSLLLYDALLPYLYSRGQNSLASFTGAIGKRLLGTTSELRAWQNLEVVLPLLKADLAKANVRDDFINNIHKGFSFASYMSYRQALEIPFYAISGIHQTLALHHPLTDINVFLAAMCLRLPDRVGTWMGFRPKLLLAAAAGTRIPDTIALQAKIGRSNLLAHMTLGMENEVTDIMLSSKLRNQGFAFSEKFADPRSMPVSTSLYWSMYFTLTMWFDGLNEYVRNEKRRTETSAPLVFKRNL